MPKAKRFSILEKLLCGLIVFAVLSFTVRVDWNKVWAYSPFADQIQTENGTFNGTLSGNDTNVQKAFETLDDVSLYTSSDFDTDFAGKNTGDLSEGTNLYYTNSRVESYLSGGTGIAFSSGTISLSHLGLQNLTDPNADRILYWNDTSGYLTWLNYDAWDTNASDDFSGSWNNLTDIPTGFNDDVDNTGTDNQTLSFSSPDLTIENGNTVDISAIDTDTTYTASDFNHDNLSNIPANDHLDWTVSQSPTTIHSDNYVDNDTTYSTSGTLLDLTSTTFSVNEGTLTDTKICTYESGTGLVCNTTDDTGTDDQTIDTFSFDGSSISLSLESDGEVDQTLDISSVDSDTNLTQEEVDDYVDVLLNDADAVNTLITVTYDDIDNAMDFVVNDDLSLYDNATSGFLTSSPFGADISYDEITGSTLVTEAEGISGNDNDTTIPTNATVKDYADSNDTDTNLTEEEVEDFVGGMLGGTETHISVDYQDGTNDIDFVVSDDWWDALGDMTLADGDIYIGDVSNNPAAQTMSGDITISNAGVTTIGADKVDASMINTINAGTNCTWDTTNDEIDVDDAFLVNDASDTTTGTLTADSYELGDGNYIGIGSGSERAVFDSTNGDISLMGGKVGIGTTAPSKLLTIQAASGNNADIRLIADAGEDSQDDWRITADGAGLKFQDTYGRYPLYLGYNAGVEVRIGTGAGYDFQVENTDGDRLFTVQGETGNVKIPKDDAKLYFGADDKASIYDDGSDFVFDNQETGSGDFYFKNGDVGIGTDNPSEKLEVAGNIAVSGTVDGRDISTLALKSNVLELDNTTAFTPDADYEPATKKYVDDNSAIRFYHELYVDSEEGTSDGPIRFDTWANCKSHIETVDPEAEIDWKVHLGIGTFTESGSWFDIPSNIYVSGEGTEATIIDTPVLLNGILDNVEVSKNNVDSGGIVRYNSNGAVLKNVKLKTTSYAPTTVTGISCAKHLCSCYNVKMALKSNKENTEFRAVSIANGDFDVYGLDVAFGGSEVDSSTRYVFQLTGAGDIRSGNVISNYPEDENWKTESDTGRVILGDLLDGYVNDFSAQTIAGEKTFSDNVGIGTASPNQKLTVEGTIDLKEQADANADNAGYGQIWVNTATPNVLYFTDDTGTDHDLTAGGTSQLSDLSDVNTAGVTDGNVLRADGVDFESTTLAISDLTFTAGTDLTLSTNTLDVDSGVTRDTEWNTLTKIESATSKDIIDSTENSDSDDDVTNDNVESMTTAGSNGTAPLSDGAGNLSMTDVWTESENTSAGYISSQTDDQTIDVFSISGDDVQLSLESDGEVTKTVDISSTTAVTANSAKVTDDDVGVDEVYGVGWNTDTASPEKDDVYDYLHQIDTDDDGSLTDETWFDLDNISGTNETGLYSLLSDVTQFYEAGDEDTIAGAISQGTLTNDSVQDADIDWAGLTDLDAGGVLATDSVSDNEIDYTNVVASDITDDRTHAFQATLFDPDAIQGVDDAVPVFAVESEAFPNGITLQDVGIKTGASSSYTVNFEEWTSPTDGSPSTIESVATSSSTEAEDDGSLSDNSISAGSIIYIDLPDTDVDMLQIWGTYTID